MDLFSVACQLFILGVISVFLVIGLLFIVVCISDCLNERRRKLGENEVTRGVTKIIANRD